MPTSSDADRAFPRLPGGKLLQVSVHPKLLAIATRIEQRYGPPRATVAQPDSILKNAAVKLARSGGKLANLTHRERKASVELCFAARDGWKPDLAFVRNWLRWAELEWNSRIGCTRIAVSYVRNYDGESDATALVGAWLAARIGQVGGRFGEVFRHYGFHDGRAAVSWVAESLSTGSSEFFARIDADTKSSAVFQGSGALVAVLAKYGAHCGHGRAKDVPATTKLLLGHVGENALGGKASQRSRDAARIAMVVGIVMWAAARTDKKEAIDVAIGACLFLAGDPRQSKARWRDIPEETVDVIHGWLTLRTIENMFQVIATLKTDHPDQVASRLEFWRGYLPHIRRAYLVCASRAKPVAENLKEPYGSLEGGDPLHCGLLMEIVGPRGDRIVVLEINKNASALFWKPNSKFQAPDFYGRSAYHRPTYLRECDETKGHRGPWQVKFAQFIESETGVRRPARSAKFA
jgi:EH_Signature domain